MKRHPFALILAGAAALTLAGCATGPSPVEVTRFHDPMRLAAAERGTVQVTAAPGITDTLALAPYRAAVAEELRQLGYNITDSSTARYRAEISVDRFVRGPEGRRSPVSVGVGGSTGSYGSGLGLGVGINLGGSGERAGTELAVALRDTGANANIWEGRAEVDYGLRSDYADARANAEVLADALFREFPGNSGETVRIDVN